MATDLRAVLIEHVSHGCVRACRVEAGARDHVRLTRNRSKRPSALHCGRVPPSARSRSRLPAVGGSRRRSRSVPIRRDSSASHLPSGENAGRPSLNGPASRICGAPPPAGRSPTAVCPSRATSVTAMRPSAATDEGKDVRGAAGDRCAPGSRPSTPREARPIGTLRARREEEARAVRRPRRRDVDSAVGDPRQRAGRAGPPSRRRTRCRPR